MSETAMRVGYSTRSNTLYDIVLRVLLVLFPILPVNYYIGPLNYSNACAILIVLFYILGHQGSNFKQFWRYNCMFWLFMLIHTIQILMTGTLITGISYFISHLLVCYVCIDYLSDENRFFRFIDSIIFVGGILGVLGIVEALSGQYLIQGALLNAENGVRYGFLRCSVTFGHPINFGMFQAIVALLAFYRLSSQPKGKHRNRIRICYIFAIISCFLSVSRLAICLFLVCQIIMALKMGVRKIFKYILIIVLAITGLSILSESFGFSFFGNLVGDFIAGAQEMFFGGSDVGSETIGFGNRLDLYDWVINDVGDQWLFGKGTDAAFSYKMYEWFTKTSIEVHYLNIYFNFGLVGVVTLVLSYVGTLFYTFKSNKNLLANEKKINFRLFLLVFLIVYYICLFGVQETDTGRIYILLISMGIAYNRIHLKKRS